MPRAFALIVSFAMTTAAAAEVYRWIDAEGQVHFSDTPVRDAERLQIDSEPTDPAAVRARQQREAALAEARALREKQQATSVTEQREAAAEIAEQHAINCDKARQRLQTVDSAHRLYRPREDGGREYLTDAELDSARAEARLDVDKWCD
ncbi:hypothetical protein BH24PSE2_BH24PSE2_10040 [soil metagenome]